MKPYEPLPGSIAAKALDHLRRHGKTAASPLAEVCDCDLVDLRMSLAPACHADVIVASKFNGLQWYAPAVVREKGAPAESLGKPRLRRGLSGNWLCVVFRKRGRGKIAVGPVGVGDTPLDAFVEWKALGDLEQRSAA